jgi:hypothetical protein
MLILSGAILVLVLCCLIRTVELAQSEERRGGIAFYQSDYLGKQPEVWLAFPTFGAIASDIIERHLRKRDVHKGDIIYPSGKGERVPCLQFFSPAVRLTLWPDGQMLAFQGRSSAMELDRESVDLANPDSLDIVYAKLHAAGVPLREAANG